MKQKILKFELVSIFFLTLISVVYYFFETKIPDNSLSISSSSADYYTIMYYISSLFAEVSFYIGPWILVPFLFFAFIYSFIISSRQRNSDVFLVFTVLIFFYMLAHIFSPIFLGQGLRIISNSFISPYVAFSVVLISGILMFYMTLRGTFFVLLKRIQFSLERMGVLLFRFISKSTKKTKQVMLSYSDSAKNTNIKNRATQILREGTEKIKQLPVVNKNSSIQESKEETFTPIVEEVKEQSFDDSISEAPEQINNKDIKKESVEQKDFVTPKISQKSESRFFKSSDLIDCISASIKHTQVKGPDDNYFTTIIKAIEEKLLEFKLDAKIINILKGPVVDTFELELGSGVKVSKVTGLSDDIGLALNGAPIRIVYPMRGKSTIGIEVPRNPRDFIFLDEVLNSQAFNDSKQRLPVAMGKDAFGDVSVVDLAAMPHMLVAGATGAGKSVFINTLLVSLIIKKSPRELKLILIDPKQLELAMFSDLPHLMLPVITDPQTSAISLLWAVQEMERRYSILKELGVKNIEGFNKKIKTCDQKLLFKINQYYEDQKDEGYELPYIVIVIDEFADLILSKAGKEIELNVNRLAAKARAAGVHLVVATQRPSTDVVTGVVKANFPTRVAFRVSTGHDSKTILDQYGAEKLLGKGDMLYKHGVDLLRLHSSFIEENEIEGLIEKLATLDQTFNQNALDFVENGGEMLEIESSSSIAGNSNYVSGSSDDPIYQDALEIVFETGSASASMIQRRLRVGYNRAANLVEEMERNGIVGPAQGSKPRKVIGRAE